MAKSQVQVPSARGKASRKALAYSSSPDYPIVGQVRVHYPTLTF
jgi:hypothetical protein